MDSLIGRLLEHPNDSQKQSNEAPFEIVVESSIPDPNNPEKVIKNVLHTSVTNSTPFASVISEFTKRYTQYDKYDITVQYNNMFFNHGVIGDAHVTSEKILTLITSKRDIPSDNQNEKFGFWILPPIILSIAFILSGIIRNVELKVRISYLIFGICLGIPTSFLFLKENFLTIVALKRKAVKKLKSIYYKVRPPKTDLTNQEDDN